MKRGNTTAPVHSYRKGSSLRLWKIQFEQNIDKNKMKCGRRLHYIGLRTLGLERALLLSFSRHIFCILKAISFEAQFTLLAPPVNIAIMSAPQRANRWARDRAPFRTTAS